MPNVEVEKVTEYPGHRGSIFAMALSADQSYLYSSGDDGIVARWDLRKNNQEATAILQAGNGIYSLAALEDGRTIVVGASDGTVYLVDLESGLQHTWRKTKDSIFHIHPDYQRNLIWILHGSGFLSALEIGSWEEVFFERLISEHLRALEVGPEGNFFLGGSDHRIVVFDPDARRPISAWRAHENSVFCLARHPHHPWLLSGGRDAHIRVWDLDDQQKELRAIPAHNFTINALVFSPSGDHFVTASRDKTLKVWDGETLELLKVVDASRNDGHRHSVNRLFWLTSDNSVISCSDDRRIIRWHFDFNA